MYDLLVFLLSYDDICYMESLIKTFLNSFTKCLINCVSDVYVRSQGTPYIHVGNSRSLLTISQHVFERPFDATLFPDSKSYMLKQNRSK